MNNWTDVVEKERQKIIEILEDFLLFHPFERDEINKIISDFRSYKLCGADDVIKKLNQTLYYKEKEIVDKRSCYWDLIDNLNKSKLLKKNENNDINNDKNRLIEGFEFAIENGIYHFILPKLQTKNSQNDSQKYENMVDNYIRDSVFQLATRKKNQLNLPSFEEFTIVFIHHFNHDNYDAFDTDNLNIKKPIDGINGVLIDNDTIGRSHIIQLTSIIEDSEIKEYTDMYVINEHSLGEWIYEVIMQNTLTKNG